MQRKKPMTGSHDLEEMSLFYKRCLLCTSLPHRDSHIHILSQTAKKLKLAENMKKYLNIEIQPELPKNICTYCAAKLNITNDLITKSQRSVLQLQQMWQKDGNRNTEVKQDVAHSSITQLYSCQPTTDTDSDCTETIKKEVPSDDSDSISDEDLDQSNPSDRDLDQSNPSDRDLDQSNPSDRDLDQSNPSDRDLDQSNPSDRDLDQSNPSDRDLDQSNPSDRDLDHSNSSEDQHQIILQEITDPPELLYYVYIDIEEQEIKQETEDTQQDCLPPNADMKSELPGCTVVVHKLMECDSCYFFTTKKSELATHMQAHQTPNTSAANLESSTSNKGRSSCSHRNSGKGAMITRIRKASNSKHIIPSHVTNGYKCEICSQTFHSEEDFKNHYAVAHYRKRRRLNLKCGHCPTHFPTFPHLEKHCRSSHPGKYVLRCDKCKNEFLSYQGYMRHSKYQHKSGPKFSCEFCNSKFNLPGNLRAHMKSLHPVMIQTYNCEVCDASFKCERYLRLHIQGVHSGKILKCKKCKYITRRRHDMTIHVKAKHPPATKIVPCRFCSADFTCVEYLRRHVREVHSGPILRCRHCKYSTRRQSDLVRHMKGIHMIHVT